MRRLLSPAILLALTLSCGAAEVQCPPIDREPRSPLEHWKSEYIGFVEQVWLYRYRYKDGTVRSRIYCYRTLGVQSFWTARVCRLIAGAGDVQTKFQFEDREGFTCKMPIASELYPAQLYNDKDCVVVCD
jgi:hypothetical protein